MREEYRAKSGVSDEATLILAQCDALEGDTYDEQRDAPPERGRALLRRAQDEARSIGALAVEIYSLCKEAAQHRKEADATSQLEAEGFTKARSLLEKAFEKLSGRDDLQGLHLLCIAEAAKVPFGQRKETEFWDYIREGRALMLHLADRPLALVGRRDSWPPAVDEFARVCFLDTELRGFALFGGVGVQLMRATARQARQFPAGLAIVQDKATLNLALGEGLLRSARHEEDRLQGIQCLGEAIQFSRATGYKRQLASAERVLRRVRLPATLHGDACWWCGPRGWFELEPSMGYKCGRCHRILIQLI